MKIIGEVQFTKHDEIMFEIEAKNIVGEGESITAASDVLFRDDDVDVSSTSLAGTLTIAGTKIITRTVKSLDEKRMYQLQVKITVNGRVYCYIIKIECIDIYG